MGKLKYFSVFRAFSAVSVVSMTQVLLFFLALIFNLSSHAGTAPQPPTSLSTAAPQPVAGDNPFGRSTSLNFEDEIVEGMNKNPFDSLTSVGKNDTRDQDRLYKKKPHFRFETKLTIREMGLLQ
jgi:hypothetical protein